MVGFPSYALKLHKKKKKTTANISLEINIFNERVIEEQGTSYVFACKIDGSPRIYTIYYEIEISLEV